jgi:hypothetical protein
LQDFLTLKGDYGRLLKGKNSTTLFPIFYSINSTKQGKKIKHSKHTRDGFGGWLFPYIFLNILLSFYVVLSIIWTIIFQFIFLSLVGFVSWKLNVLQPNIGPLGLIIL